LPRFFFSFVDVDVVISDALLSHQLPLSILASHLLSAALTKRNQLRRLLCSCSRSFLNSSVIRLCRMRDRSLFYSCTVNDRYHSDRYREFSNVYLHWCIMIISIH
jgi:hypothetical protein